MYPIGKAKVRRAQHTNAPKQVLVYVHTYRHIYNYSTYLQLQLPADEWRKHRNEQTG